MTASKNRLPLPGRTANLKIQPKHISTKQLAEWCNLTERWLRQLAQEGKLPQPTGGRWPTMATINRLFSHYQQHGPELAAEKLRRLTAQRRLAEMEADRVAGTLLDRNEVGPLLRNLAANQRNALQAKLEIQLPAKLAGLAPIEIQLRMTEVVDEICRMHQTHLRQWLETAPPTP